MSNKINFILREKESFRHCLSFSLAERSLGDYFLAKKDSPCLDFSYFKQEDFLHPTLHFGLLVWNNIK
jgi:hypothetical protein